MVQETLIILSDWMDVIVPAVMFLLALAVYFQRKRLSLRRWSRVLILATLVYYPLYALINTVSQYEVWANSSGSFLKYLADAPLAPALNGITLWYDLPFMHGKFGYVIFYSWGRFWMGPVLAVAAAFLFWLILKGLQRYNDRFFEDGEVELGVLMALLVGWPGFVVFVPLLFVSVIIVSAFRLIFFSESYTTLGAPMLFAALLFFIFASQLLAITGFQVLKA